MIRIAICDDQSIFIDELEALLTHYSEAQEIPLNIERFTAGSLLLTSEKSYDLIFLDIDMPELDGMSVAKALRLDSCQSLIVFVTSHDERVFDAFEVNAFRFLVKPATIKNLSTAMNEAIILIREKQSNVLSIELSTNRFVRIPISDVLYIESLGKYIYIQTTVERYESRQSLRQFEELLESKGFFRAHKSYLVNLKQVKTHTYQEIVLFSGETINLSRLKSSAFKKAFIAELMRTR